MELHDLTSAPQLIDLVIFGQTLAPRMRCVSLCRDIVTDALMASSPWRTSGHSAVCVRNRGVRDTPSVAVAVDPAAIAISARCLRPDGRTNYVVESCRLFRSKHSGSASSPSDSGAGRRSWVAGIRCSPSNVPPRLTWSSSVDAVLLLQLILVRQQDRCRMIALMQ